MNTYFIYAMAAVAAFLVVAVALLLCSWAVGDIVRRIQLRRDSELRTKLHYHLKRYRDALDPDMPEAARLAEALERSIDNGAFLTDWQLARICRHAREHRNMALINQLNDENKALMVRIRKLNSENTLLAVQLHEAKKQIAAS